MKKAALILFICVSALLTGYSQTKQESIKELFQLMQKDSVIDRAFSSMMDVVNIKQLKDSTITDEAKNSLLSKIQIVKKLSLKLQHEEMALYDKYYTQNEITDLITFYKSPLGQKSIVTNEGIQNDLRQIVRQKYMSEITDMVMSIRGIN